jgi:tetratricopeptide (TPR) repeat protein
MSHEEHSDPEALLAPLDGEPGPMPVLAPERAAALTSSVVARWSNALSGVEPADGNAGPAVPLAAPAALQLVRGVARRHARVRPWRAAAVAGAMLSVGGLAFGALHEWGRAAAPVAASTSRNLQTENGPASAMPSAVAGSEVVATQPVVVANANTELAANGGALPRALGDSNASVQEAATLEHANALRAARSWHAAQREYLRIAESGAGSRERYVASVAAAALCLQHTGEPRRALSLYRRALRALPQGDLSEDVRLGVARAFNALHDEAAEADALREFLAHHPESLDADAARQRLAVLAAGQ